MEIIVACKKRKTKHRPARSYQDWLKGGWVDGEDEYCSCCKRQKPNNELRNIDPGPGRVCMQCWETKPSCSNPGCSDIAVERGLCRDHFVGANEEPGFDTAEYYGGMKSSSISLFGQQETFGGVGTCRKKGAA